MWFGPFKPFSNGWNFHASFGWLYGSVKNESSIWLWRNHLGWLWLNSEVFPFCFSHSESDWLYLGLASGFTDSIRYYSYRDKEWKPTWDRSELPARSLKDFSLIKNSMTALKSLFLKRELLWQFLMRNVKVRHRGSILGEFGYWRILC